MVGSRTPPGSPPVKFFADFGRHLGPSWALDGSQNETKIIKKSTPKSFKNSSLLWRRQGGPGRPQDGPKTAPRRPKILQERKNLAKMEASSHQNRFQISLNFKMVWKQKMIIFLYNFHIFYVWRHPFPCQKRWKNLNKSRLVLLKRFFALEWP